MRTIRDITNAIDNIKTRSAWGAGVKTYAYEILDNIATAEAEHRITLATATRSDLLSAALNGADNWRAYSYGGCSLICDSDIAATLCTPSERPNARENWLDVQADALETAFAWICMAADRD